MRAQLSRWFLFLMSLGIMIPGCATQPSPEKLSESSVSRELIPDSLHETPNPDGAWRGHHFSLCSPEDGVPKAVESLLGLCSEYFREGSGSDGMLEIELALESGQRHPLLLLTLGQLYLIAGQGEPDLLPPEGPAGDVGDWGRNKIRLLARSESLLREAAKGRPGDAAIDFLLADIARAREDFLLADELVSSGGKKCTSGRGFATLRLYQQLNQYPGKYLGGPGPEYPSLALKKRITGDVVLDLLIDPAGLVRQAVVIESPSWTLSLAASSSLRAGAWEPARVGKYPVWSWLRVSTSFSLES